ncbi:hypothetical protein NG827_00230 [Xanthomonas sacchari]|uniref:hypothetical protein n=1 Tax=Xanthomonas sacchari TaxID=56458 RepID=UPI00224D9835|nr:hypothetical protein [Xanthomonas sacchari]UYK84892.1 hypothetical protein NG827_00230 [Xanthomonas sacchari]
MLLPSLQPLKPPRPLRSPQQEQLLALVLPQQLVHLPLLEEAHLQRAAQAWLVAWVPSLPQLPHLLLFR